MTFNEGANVGSGNVSRRGRNGAIAGGGGILGIIVVFVISQLTGVNVGGLLPGGDGGAAGPEEELNCTVEQANSDDACRVEAATASLEVYWSGIAPELGFTYVPPTETIVFDGATETGCGSATAAVGPFYCPPDSTIYLDTAFYADLRDKFGASGGPLAQLYIIGHEWGHHIQHIAGITDGLDLQATGDDSDSVRLELQADCFAGAWIGAASEIKDEDGTTFLAPVTQLQINDALNAAAAVGDDNIQEKTQGQTNPEGWTHGSSESRQKWFEAGRSGGPNACNTFEVAGSAL